MPRWFQYLQFLAQGFSALAAHYEHQGALKVLLPKSPDQLNQNLLEIGHWHIMFFKASQVIAMLG